MKMHYVSISNDKQAISLLWILVNIFRSVCSCSFPLEWKDKTYKDAAEGLQDSTIHFFSTNMFSPITIAGVTINLWDCVESNGKEIVIKGQSTITLSSQTHYAYRCLLYTPVNGSLFYYFPKTNLTEGVRVHMSTDPNLQLCDICTKDDPELHTVYYNADLSCGCKPDCSILTISGTCSSPTIDTSSITCTSSSSSTDVSTVSTSLSLSSTSSSYNSSTSNNGSAPQKEALMTAEIVVIATASLLVLTIVVVTTVTGIYIYHRNEVLKRKCSKICTVSPMVSA